MDQTDWVEIKHARNGRDYRLPELHYLSVDGYCPETITVYGFFGCFWHGISCQPFRVLFTTNDHTLAARYEHVRDWSR